MIVCSAESDLTVAQAAADELAVEIWRRRADWIFVEPSPEEAIAEADSRASYPAIIADQGDNTGGGAPGDSTHILRLFVARGLQQAAVLYVVDPESAAACNSAGVGATVQLQVGGKSHPNNGPPVPMAALVEWAGEAKFTYDGPMWRGREDNLGLAALVRQAGVQVVIISAPQQPIDLALCRLVGLDCAALKYICVKSTGHFRSGAHLKQSRTRHRQHSWSVTAVHYFRCLEQNTTTNALLVGCRLVCCSLCMLNQGFGPIAASIFNVRGGSIIPELEVVFAKQGGRRRLYDRPGGKVYPLDMDAELLLTSSARI
eukprot:SAG11_NODE_2084_length_3847_cov_2.877801_3_plen_315_part_00